MSEGLQRQSRLEDDVAQLRTALAEQEEAGRKVEAQLNEKLEEDKMKVRLLSNALLTD